MFYFIPSIPLDVSPGEYLDVFLELLQLRQDVLKLDTFSLSLTHETSRMNAVLEEQKKLIGAQKKITKSLKRRVKKAGKWYTDPSTIKSALAIAVLVSIITTLAVVLGQNK